MDKDIVVRIAGCMIVAVGVGALASFAMLRAPTGDARAGFNFTPPTDLSVTGKVAAGSACPVAAAAPEPVWCSAPPNAGTATNFADPDTWRRFVPLQYTCRALDDALIAPFTTVPPGFRLKIYTIQLAPNPVRLRATAPLTLEVAGHVVPFLHTPHQIIFRAPHQGDYLAPNQSMVGDAYIEAPEIRIASATPLLVLQPGDPLVGNLRKSPVPTSFWYHPTDREELVASDQNDLWGELVVETD